MAVQIQLRRDTAANWTSNNPILAQGEIGIETDTKKKKIGDGVTSWTSLSYESHTQLGDVGTNTHAQIDSHISNVNNPHSVTANQVLPDQSGHSGQFLQTDGANADWVTVSGGAGSGITIEEGGVEQGSGIDTLNFESGATVDIDGTTANITISGGGGAGATDVLMVQVFS